MTAALVAPESLDPRDHEALLIARELIAAGVPVGRATPARGPDGSWDPTGGRGKTGYDLPPRWQFTEPDPSILDRWQAGDALMLICGHGLDLLDADDRHGGDETRAGLMAAGLWPTSYGTAQTPSGGTHDFVASLRVRSRDSFARGVDYKGGDADGNGRGFGFIEPTVRLSKTTRELTRYEWSTVPDLAALSEASDQDDSGDELREMIRRARGESSEYDTGRPGQGPSPAWTAAAVAGIQAELRESATWPEDYRDGRGRGWEKLQADAAMRLGSLARADQCPITLDEAKAAFLTAAPTSSTWTRRDLEEKWRSQHRRGEPAFPHDSNEGFSFKPDEADTDRIQSASSAGTKHNPARYFDKVIGLKAATLAADIIKMGPLAFGVDDILWSYDAGVWSPDKGAARARAAHLLGERYRRSHGTNAEDVVRAQVPVIRCDPISASINFRNGLYMWQADMLYGHTPDVLSTVQMSVDYSPDAECPAFDKFLTEVLPVDMLHLVWELIGYLMYSGNPLHKAVMLVGTGRNGKGTFLRVIDAVLGKGNVTSVSLHDLVNTRFSTASLFGKIANIAGDIDGSYLESTATFKAITGQDMISAEHKGRDRFDFTPWAVPVFSANKIPASSDVTTGYLSRWLVVPFPHDFTGREDRHLDARLQTNAELEGIAAKAAPALRRLMARGEFDLPESGIQARDEFTRRVDQVRTWVDECADVNIDYPFAVRTELYRSYKSWTVRDGHKAVKAGEFYDRLSSIPGVVASRRHGGERGFTGITVTDTAQEGSW